METSTIERTLTELDHVRLTKLVQRVKGGRAADPRTASIEHLLDEADVVPREKIAADLVTMQSQVLIRDVQTGTESTFTLTYPDDSGPLEGSVSVLSPVGWNLLGQKVGAIVRWPTPAGDERTAEIVKVLFQPEASGEIAM